MNTLLKDKLHLMRRGKVPQGYIKTSIGIFPSDWRVTQLQELVRVFRGASPRPKGDPKYYGGNIPRLMIEDVTRDGKYVVPLIDSLTEEGAKKSRLLPEGSVVLSCSGTRVAIPGILQISACIHDGFFGFDDYKGLFPEYLYYFFELFHEKMQSSATKGGVFNNLTTQIMKVMIVQVPSSEEEQRRIVSILRTWDKVIELKEKLIEQKKEQRKGLMQKLLTGKERLPGFEGKWENNKIKDIAEIYLGLTYTPKYVAKGVPFLSVKDLDGDKLNFGNVKYISREEFENSTSNAKPKKGDLLFGRVGTLGNPVILNEDTEFCIFVSLGFLRMKNDNFFNYFVKYWMQSDLFIKQVESKVSGSSQKNLNTGWLKEFELKLPKIEEQQAIVNILLEADKEINLLEQEQSLLKQQKKGLMQLLLTGKVRV